MTKAEEKATFAAFVAGLPRSSYLRPMLEDIRGEVETAITNDLGFLTFSERIAEQRAHVAECAALQNRLNELKAECRRLDSERAKLAVALDNVKADVRTLFRTVNAA
jgi:predicted nuclease with TOPRIM domain